VKRLRWFDFAFINIFWLGMNIRNTAVGTIFMPFLVERYAPTDWRNTALSAMGTAGLIIAMVVQPIAGLLSDRSTSRFGRRRPFIMAGTLLDLVFLAAIGLSWNYWSLLVAILLIQFSANVSHGPLRLIPTWCPKTSAGGHRQSKLYSNWWQFSWLASPWHHWWGRDSWDWQSSSPGQDCFLQHW
jgi:MFS family permease